jgi:GR25 family glycosyltransferase involved in LPS biosynthesis
MLHIGVTYNPTIDLFTSGYNQTSIVLAELFQHLSYNVSLISIKDSEKDWWDDFPRMQNLNISNIYTHNNLDYLIDIDALLKPTYRKNLAKQTIVFLRTFMQFEEMEITAYPEKAYVPRYFDNILEIWCWDILNSSESIPAIQTLFQCPIRPVPFIWSKTIASHYSDKIMPYSSNSPWNVHIAEKNNNNISSSIIPLVAIRELVMKNILDAKYKCHNMERIIDNRFLKENILNNIDISNLPVSFEKKEPFYKWLQSENNILFSHSRFIPIRTALLNALWLGIPVIHNSPILKSLHPELEKLFYFGNEFSGIISAFSNFILNPEKYFDAVLQIRHNILVNWSIPAKSTEWKTILQSTFIDINPTNKINTHIPSDHLIIAFSDMWPGFNFNSNFIIDAIRQNTVQPITGQEYNSLTTPNLVIIGPYSNNWKDIPKNIPKVFFSAENWNIPDDPSIKLYLTSSRQEDEKHMRIPTWMMFIDWYSTSTVLPENCQDNPIRIPIHFATTKHSIPFEKRENFCAFVVSNPICNFRNETFKAIDNYKKVNSGGALYNNIGGQLSLKYAGGGCGDISKYNFFSNHKFTISFENSQASGYITEKVLHSKMAGCIPIYWGDNQTDSDFVPNSFVNLSNISDPQKVVEIIKLLENNPNVCNHYASTPILDETKKQKALKILENMAIKLINLAIGNKESRIKMPKRIDKAYLVNLDTRPDRLETLYKEEPYLEQIITRIPAVNGKTLKMNKTIYELFKNNSFQWKKSAMGCNLSHIHIWSSIMKESGDYFLVLEDDVRFNKNWLNDWDKYADNIPEDAELLYLGGVLPPNKKALPLCTQEINSYWSEIKPNTLFSQIPLPIFHFCTYSYIITKKGAEKMLNFLRNSEMKSYAVVDHLLGSPHVNLKKYVSNPLIAFCFQDSDPVYINSEFNSLHRKDNFDSDIWNNTECFTQEELEPFHKEPLILYCYDQNKKYNLYEENWIQDIFDRQISLIPFNDFEFIPPNNSWFIVQRPYIELFSNYFNFLKKHNISFKVLHLSDEFSKDSIDFYTYSNCKAVVRNYLRSDIPDLPYIITVPLGYHYKGLSSKLFYERELIWSFHGTDWFNRRNSLEKMYSLMPHHTNFTNTWNDPNQSSESNYLGTLANSKFCPILRGNNIETFRLYEVLEIGTIPIYVRNQGDDKFWEVISKKLGLVELTSWENAIKFIKTLLSDTNRAEIYRQEIITCWNSWKSEIKSSIQQLK